MSNYAETLAGAADEAITRADEAQAILVDPGSARDEIGREPISYGQHRSFSFAIDTLKGRNTRKGFHVVITRLDSGRYEIVAYVL